MKNIIRKNIKILFRSKMSMFLLLFGPLLIILLVGISFSTETFNLKIGVYSQSYSDMSREYIQNLANATFKVIQYKDEAICIDAVKQQKIHACIVFPPDMDVENENENLINFYVDQSKINVVHFTMSQLSSSFGEVSSEVSRDLTDKILTSLFSTKQGLESADATVRDIISQNNVVISNADTIKTTISSVDLKTDTATINISVESVTRDLSKIREDSLVLLDESVGLLDDIEDSGSLNANQSSSADDLREDLGGLRSLMSTRINATNKELVTLAKNIDLSVGKLTTKMKNADNTNKDVIFKLDQLKTNAQTLSRNAEALDLKLTGMVAEINSIEIVNSDNIVSPIKVQINKIAEPGSNLGFLFPSLVVIFIMFLGFMLTSSMIISEKSSKAFFRVFTTPTNPINFVIAAFFTSLLLISLQVMIILAVSYVTFGIDIFQNFILIMLSTFLIMTLFILVGMLLGYLINSEEIAMLASVSISTLFLLTSGLIFPTETMPGYVANMIQFNPLVSSSDAFRKSLLFDANISSLLDPLQYILITIAVLLIIFLSSRLLPRLQINKKDDRHYEDRHIAKQFQFSGRAARTLPEFVISVQMLSESRLVTLLEEDAIRQWILRVYKDEHLASSLVGKRDRKQILDLLLEEVKKLQQKGI
jgi:ABC-type multidrug transport system permease subunit